MNPFNWTCPFCRRPQTVTEKNHFKASSYQRNGKGVDGDLLFTHESIRCLNPECTKMSLVAWLSSAEYSRAFEEYKATARLELWRLLPGSISKPQPDFIPKVLRDDYYEACLIRELSPKASATLARRCLQGMIRDFCGINRKTLFDEIKELEKSVNEGNAPKGVTPESVEAIDHVRSIGNIGAHMEADVNTIIEIDPDEAQELIGLIEMLFEEWYVARHDRNQRLAKIAATRAAKDALKEGGEG
jgi:hypothetical protein